MNFSDVYSKKIEVTGSYFYNHSNNVNQKTSLRNSFTGDDHLLNYQENRQSRAGGKTPRFNFRTEYKIDSFNTMILSSKDHFQNKRAVDDFQGENFYSVSSPASHISSNINSTSNGRRVNNTLVFKHLFGRRGRAMVFEYADERDESTGNKNLMNLNNYHASSLEKTDSLAQVINMRKRSVERTADISFTEPVGTKSLLMFHLSPQLVNEQFVRNTFCSDNNLTKPSRPDSGLSTSFTSRYLGHQGGIGYKIGAKENQFTVELDYRVGKLDGQNPF